MTVLRIATRGSNLALWQARHVAALLKKNHPHLRIQLVIVNSSGDGDHATPLYKMGNIGIFVKEVQQAIVAGKADLGVHSMKDLPTDEPDGLLIAAILKRADPRDVLVGGQTVSSLAKNALIGTSSLRRQAQLQALRPDVQFTSIRGNVETRLRKVKNGDVATTLMAYAGLKRLGLLRKADISILDPWRECTPAPAQGAVAVDCRANDNRTQYLLSCLHHHDTAQAVTIERQVLQGLFGGCSLPLGCYAERRAGTWNVIARLGSEQGLRSACARGAAHTLADDILRQLR
jgi:hydroxymethylbilane synthase